MMAFDEQDEYPGVSPSPLRGILGWRIKGSWNAASAGVFSGKLSPPMDQP